MVTGQVLRVDTGAAPTSATVTIGGQALAVAGDGTFSGTVSASANSLTVTATGAVTRTISITLTANSTTNLGTIYVSPTGYNATVTGRVVTMVNGQTQPVGNATVNIASVQTNTATDGTFTLNNLPVGLGTIPGEQVGKVTAKGFQDKPITSETLIAPLVAGSNPIGDIAIAQPSGSTPPPAYTITGVVTVQGKPQAGVQVSLASGGTNLGSTATDANGNYYFWVVPATYTITASAAGVKNGQTTVTLQSLNAPVTASTIDLNP